MVKVLKKGQFQHEATCQEGASKHAAACLEGYFKHTSANMFYKSTNSLVGRATDSPRARVVSLGHFIPIALMQIKPQEDFLFLSIQGQLLLFQND